MALTCEIMKVDRIFILYENSGKYFKSYEEAYFNTKKPFAQKTVNYVFTPTMCKYRRVSELESASKEYFNRVSGCDFYDIVHRVGTKQLNLLGE